MRDVFVSVLDDVQQCCWGRVEVDDWMEVRVSRRFVNNRFGCGSHLPSHRTQDAKHHAGIASDFSSYNPTR